MAFIADFEINGNNAFTNEPIEFISLDEDTNGNPLGIGIIPDSHILNTDFEIVGEGVTINDVTEDDGNGGLTFKIGYDTVTTITKKEWRTEGSFFAGDSLIFSFDRSGDIGVTYTIYSEYYNFEGKLFQYRISEPKDVRIFSMFFKILTDNYPLWEKVKSDELEDMFVSFSRFFDRMYEDTKGVFNNIDIENLAPELLEYMAITLGHTENYIKKVGGNISDPNFSDYDIYERIKSGDASDDEIKNFRRFLLFSAELFKNKGTPDNIITLMSFYHMNAQIKELWTATWSAVPFGVIHDNFAGLELFEDNAFGFRWMNMRVIGNSNDKGHFSHNFKTFIVDSYHHTQKIEYPADLNGTLSNGWLEFIIEAGPEFVDDVRFENGELFVDIEIDDDIKYWDIVKRDNIYYLQIDNNIIDYGDRISVKYRTSEDNITDSLVAQDSIKSKNIDIITKFKFRDISTQLKNTNTRLPENEIFVAIRGINRENNLYANFNDYYRVSINSRRSTFNISRIFENDQSKNIVIQNINLSGNSNNFIWEGLIIDDNNENYIFKNDFLYEIWVTLIGSKISVFFREDTIDQTIETNIASDIGGNKYGDDNGKWICLVSGLDIDVTEANILSVDQNGDEVISVNYVYNDTAGFYGVGSRSGIIEFSEITVNNLDSNDTLYSTIEKELIIKPKYLDWQDNDLILYNSYNNDTNSFSQVISDDFDPLISTYSVSEDLSQSLQFLYFDKASVSEILGSRYTVTFDQDWITKNFNSGEDVISKILIPIGEQAQWFLPESRIQNKDFYKNIFGTDETVSISTTGSSGTCGTTGTTGTTGIGTTGTTGTTGSSGTLFEFDVPGFFNFNKNPVLTDYETEPLDSFSSLTRSDNGFGNELILSNKMQEYKNGGEKIYIKGVYEEVSPLSTYWPEYDGELNLKDGTQYSNRVTFPIVIDSSDYKRFVGIRFRHCKDIQTLIDRGSFENEIEVPIYGTYIFTMPNESVKFRPDRDIELTPSAISGHVDVTVTIPLGILNSSIQNYSLGAEFMHQVNNSGITNISLHGIFIRYPSSNFIYNDVDNMIILDETNPFEKRERGLKCKIYIQSTFSLASKLEDFEVPLDASRVPNKFLMQSTFRNMLKSLEKSDGYSQSIFIHDDGTKFSDQEILDYVYEQWTWWSPKKVYRKRDFEQIPNDTAGSITTGFNFDPIVNTSKSFFGQEFTAENNPNGVSSQKFKITDGSISSKKMYYAKIIVRENWAGYNALGLSSVNGQNSKPLTTEEYADLFVSGSINEKPSSHIMSPVGSCLSFLVPISWYENAECIDTLEWGNYISGVHGTDDSPSVTLTPFGLMSWMYQHATGDINTTEFVDNVKQVTSGWTVTDWNERFWDLVNIEFICEEVEEENYKLMDEFGFVTKYAPSTGAYVEVESDIGDLDWEVSGLSYLVPNTLGGYYYNIPRNVKPFRDWNEDITRLDIFNYIVPSALYSFDSPIQFTLTDDVIFDSFGGASFKARTFFDLFFENEKFETITDNFGDTREINWTVYQNNADDMYELGVRKPSTVTAFGLDSINSSDPIFDIINIDGSSSFRRIEDSTIGTFDPKRIGINTKPNSYVQEDDNGGYKKSIYFVDSKNEVFDISAEVYFDEALNDIKNYNGKRFEFILKANNNFNSKAGSYNIEEYYFVGIGTFGFDISLGVVRYDFFNNTIQKTFLAGFGDFNTRTVKTSTWYDLKCKVNGNYIQVFFNENEKDERLVLNYNIEPSRKDDSSRFIDGQFEELIYLVSGLDKLDITYPGTLQSKTNSIFYNENWNEDFARSIRPSGPLSGMRIFNDLTYVSNLTYKAKIQDNRIYGDVSNVNDITDIIEKIKVEHNPVGSVKFFSKTLNGTYIILIGTNLFYQLTGKNSTFYSDDISDVSVYRDKVLIKFNCNKIRFIVEDDDFKFSRNLFVKDAVFNTDHIFKYMEFTKRQVKQFWVADGKLHVEFQPDGDECNPWGFSVWGDPVWGCFEACLFD